MGLNNTQKGMLLTFTGFTLFTLVDACAKWLGDSYDVSVILFWLYSINLSISLFLGLLLGAKKYLGTRSLTLHLTRSFCMIALSGFSIAALSNGLSLATFYTIIFLSPALTSLAAVPLYKETISRGSWLVILLGFAGIVVAFHKDISFFTIAVFYAVGALGARVAVNLLIRPIDKRDSILTLPFYPALVIVISQLIYMRGDIPLPTVEDVPIFALGGVIIFFAMICIMQGFRIGAYAKVAPMQYTQMLWAILIGYYMFGDTPGMWMLVGSGMVIASGLLLITQKK